ncbi:MAG TPA: RHS repeat-associated core domain-containing protein [Burkholderiales bacterium]|nr:RHS repeat-associated core domain-containing protein [Burkholderiales bacterium]
MAQSSAAGAIDGTQRFDAWGNKTTVSGTAVATYGYSGREPDASGLIYYRARYYDPSMRRFTQRDPIGLQGGINLYAYVGNNPVNLVDPLGLTPADPLSNQLAQNNQQYFGGPIQVACAPACPPLGVQGLTPPPAASSGTPGYQGLPQPRQDAGGFEGITDTRTGPPHSTAQQVLGGVLNGLANPVDTVRQFINNLGLIFNEAKSPAEILMPGGVPIGTSNRRDETTRNVQGGEQAALAIFGQLTQGGVPANKPDYPGTGVIIPGGGFVGYRSASNSKSGVPAIDVNIPGIDIGKLHFP